MEMLKDIVKQFYSIPIILGCVLFVIGVFFPSPASGKQGIFVEIGNVFTPVISGKEIMSDGVHYIDSRIATDMGANIIFTPFCTEDRQGYLRVRYCAQARAVENQIYTVISGVSSSEVHSLRPGFAEPPPSEREASYFASITSMPPRYFLRTSGTTMEPSARWFCSTMAGKIREVARPEPFRV